MDLTYKNIVQEMLNRVPQLRPIYNKELEELWKEEEELPPHIAFGNILNPFLIYLLQKADELRSEDKESLYTIFNLLEEMALSNEVHVQEVVSVTVMARIADDIRILSNALNYMGAKTKILCRETEIFYGRNENLKILK